MTARCSYSSVAISPLVMLLSPDTHRPMRAYDCPEEIWIPKLVSVL